MATWGPRLITSQQAVVVAALTGAQHDLETAAVFCKQLAAVDLSSPDGSLLVDALSTAIAIRYCRCFTTGVRQKHTGSVLDGIVVGLPERLREIHAFIRLIRDKHIAHSVNDFEENYITVHVREAPDPPELGGIGTMQARTIPLSPENAIDVMDLCEALASALGRVIDEQNAQLSREIAGLPIEEVYQFPEPQAYVPDWDKIHLARKWDGA